METLLLKYGYAVLFFGVLVEGEAFLLAAGFLAHRGYLQIPLVIAVAMASTTLGDHFYFRAARARGRAWLERRKGKRARYSKLIDMTARRGPWLMLASRFAFGLRIVIPAACGAVGMRPILFTIMDVISVGIWAVAVSLLGYYGGAAIGDRLTHVKNVAFWVAMAVALSLAAVVSFRRRRRQGRWRELGISDVHALVPFVIGLIGLVDVISAVWPRSQVTLSPLARWLPLEVTQGSRALTLFAGLALLQVTRNLGRRKEVAWWVATIALAVSLLVSIGQGLDFQHSLVAWALLGYLLVFRRRFHARSDPATLRRALVVAPVLGVVLIAFGYVGLEALASEFEWPAGATPLGESIRTGILILHPDLHPLTVQAARFLVSVQVAGWIARLYLLVLLLRPVILHKREEAPAEALERMAPYAENALAGFALGPDKHHLQVADGAGLVGYAVRRAVAVACGDPLGPPEHRPRAVRDFLDHCQRNGWTPSVFGAAEPTLAVYSAEGLNTLKIGDEALVGPEEAMAAALLEGIAPAEDLEVWRYDRRAEPDPVLDEQIEEVSDEWLAARELGELSFSFTPFSLEQLDLVPVFVCGRRSGPLQAFCTWLPYRKGEAAALDLLRRRREVPEDVRERLLAASLRALAAQGVHEASLGFVPLPATAEAPGRLDRGVALVLQTFGVLYGYHDLFALKDRLRPRWEGRHLAYPADSLPRVALAVADVHVTHEGGLPLPHVVTGLTALVRGFFRRIRADR
jgi:phosphatidylglycerol lysyltransferase